MAVVVAPGSAHTLEHPAEPRMMRFFVRGTYVVLETWVGARLVKTLELDLEEARRFWQRLRAKGWGEFGYMSRSVLGGS